MKRENKAPNQNTTLLIGKQQIELIKHTTWDVTTQTCRKYSLTTDRQRKWCSLMDTKTPPRTTHHISYGSHTTWLQWSNQRWTRPRNYPIRRLWKVTEIWPLITTSLQSDKYQHHPRRNHSTWNHSIRTFQLVSIFNKEHQCLKTQGVEHLTFIKVIIMLFFWYELNIFEVAMIISILLLKKILQLSGTSSQLYYHGVPGEATNEFSFAICTYKQLNLIHWTKSMVVGRGF